MAHEVTTSYLMGKSHTIRLQNTWLKDNYLSIELTKQLIILHVCIVGLLNVNYLCCGEGETDKREVNGEEGPQTTGGRRQRQIEGP